MLRVPGLKVDLLPPNASGTVPPSARVRGTAWLPALQTVGAVGCGTPGTQTPCPSVVGVPKCRVPAMWEAVRLLSELK